MDTQRPPSCPHPQEKELRGRPAREASARRLGIRGPELRGGRLAEGRCVPSGGGGQVTADGGRKAREDRRGEETGREPRRQERIEWPGWGAGAAAEAQTWPSPGTFLPGTQRRTDFRSLAHARTELVHKVAGRGGAALALPVPPPTSPPLPSPPHSVPSFTTPSPGLG